MKSDKRRLMDAPCGVDSWNTKLRIFEKEYPNVTCDYRCATCGFNPNEKARRLTQGHIVNVLHFTKEKRNA